MKEKYRIAVVLTLPAEYTNSSNIRAINIINALYNAGHYIKCYMPYPDYNHRYYSHENTFFCDNIMRYGREYSRHNSNLSRCAILKKRIREKLTSVIRKIDVFGSTLLHLSYRQMISKDINRGTFDILVSFSDPKTSHMIGKYCKQHNRGLKYIQQWGDPLASDSFTESIQPFWLKKVIERSLIKCADRICYVSPVTYEKQQRLFPKQAKKMIFLPTPSLNYHEKVTNEEMGRGKDRICVGYFGSYYSIARNIIPLYKVAKKMKNVDFLFIGDSDLRIETEDNIVIKDRVPKDEIDKYVAKTDVIVCLMNRQGNQIPGKLYHDASLRKDILVIKDGENGDQIEDFFSQYNHYTFVDNTEEAIYDIIQKYSRYGIPMREPVKDFSADYVADKLISL